MPLDAVVSTVKVGREVLSLLKGNRTDRLDARYGEANDRVIDALRRIYFTPNGVRKILIELAAGRHPTAEQISEVLVNFNDVEWDVERYLHSIEFDELQARREITLKAAEQLDQIRYGKINVRKQIQQALNEPLTKDQPIDSAVAANLLADVDELNALILELEDAHNYRARGR